MDIYREVTDFYGAYRGEKRVIGKSAEGRNIYAMLTGAHTRPVGISQYAMHAREWITARLALEHIRRGTARGGVWVIPLVNPDGALLSVSGADSVKTAWRRAMLLRINKGEDFSLWKANGDAVDLNVNFDARWGLGRGNVTYPAPEEYIGSRPFCAPESLALKDFTYLVRPDYTVSWHTKGEEIYWRFHQPFFRALRDKKLAKRLRESTGYPLKETPFSAGGYKDWCIETLKIPAFTIEVGDDCLTHPLGDEAIEDIVRKNADAIRALSMGF